MDGELSTDRGRVFVNTYISPKTPPEFLCVDLLPVAVLVVYTCRSAR